MIYRTATQSVVLFVALAGGVACSFDAETPWDPVRAGLVGGSFPNGELPPAGVAVGEVVAAKPTDAQVAIGDAIVEIDRALLIGGRDSLLAARYTIHGEHIVAEQCGDVFDATPLAGAVDVLPGFAAAERRWLGQVQEQLVGWALGCGVIPEDTPLRVVAAPGAPVGVALWPDGDVVLVNPAFLEIWAERSVVTNLRTESQALIGAESFEDCLDELANECRTCTASAGAQCQALFSSGETCVDLDSLREARTRFCIWHTFDRDASRWTCAIEEGLGFDWLRGCLRNDIPVVSVATLQQATPGFEATAETSCYDVLYDCAVREPAIPEFVVPEIVTDLAGCTQSLTTYCEACVTAGTPGCAPLFEGSTGPTDCFDLRRAENNNAGPGTYCASLAITEGNIACMNAGGACVDRFYWEEGIASFDELVLAMTPFFTDGLRCYDRAGECVLRDNLQFPDYNDGNATPPTFDAFVNNNDGSGESQKCGR